MGALVALTAMLLARPAAAHIPVGISILHDELSSWGEWVDAGPYGYCWRPSHVAEGWQPYLNGSWVTTEYGFTWISRDPWGSDTYHYGTWVRAEPFGWLWIPGTVWASAWVTWLWNDDAVGWAPLPPGFRFLDAGYTGTPVVVSRDSYVVVPASRVLETDVAAERLPVSLNGVLVRTGRAVTGFTVSHGVMSNAGPPVQELEFLAGKVFQKRSARASLLAPVTVKETLRGVRGTVSAPVELRERVLAPLVARSRELRREKEERRAAVVAAGGARRLLEERWDARHAGRRDVKRSRDVNGRGAVASRLVPPGPRSRDSRGTPPR